MRSITGIDISYLQSYFTYNLSGSAFRHLVVADYLSPVKDGKISLKTIKPSPLLRTFGLGDGFLFYSYAIFSARKGCTTKNYLLSLILDSCALIRLLRGCRKAKQHKRRLSYG